MHSKEICGLSTELSKQYYCSPQKCYYVICAHKQNTARRKPHNWRVTNAAHNWTHMLIITEKTQFSKRRNHSFI